MNFNKIDEENYVKSLENLLIFMCKTYSSIEETLLKLAEEDNEALFKVPLIQGNINFINISLY